MPGDRDGAGREFREQMGLRNPAAAAVPAPAPVKRDDVLGHRARLRQRLLEGGPAGIADYEMLELVLFRAIPQRDVKPLAKRLIAAISTARSRRRRRGSPRCRAWGRP